MRRRGHEVEVIAAHPHYPEPKWGSRLLPYREVRDGISVLRLPLAIGRDTTARRLAQEASFALAQLAALPALARPDVMVVVSPCFPALMPAILNARIRRLPWVLWLQDLLPDGAVATDIVKDGLTIRMSRLLERAAYRDASRIVGVSRSFSTNLAQKAVPPEKVSVIFNPATRMDAPPPPPGSRDQAPRLLSMGNIGRTQGLADLVASFERSDSMREMGVELVITGGGVAAEDTAREIRSDRVRMLGVVDAERLDAELNATALALVSQAPDHVEFNLPSKLMNFMARGIPVLAVVSADSECARVVREADAGWVVDPSDPQRFPETVARVLKLPGELASRGERGRAFARDQFAVPVFADRFESLLSELSHGPRPPRIARMWHRT